MQDQASLQHRWRSFLGGGSDIITSIFASQGGRHIDYGLMPMHFGLSIPDARPEIMDAPLTLIFGTW